MRLALLLLALIQIAACNPGASEISNEIARQFESSGRKSVTLSKAVPGTWERVCILGPYSDNKAAKNMLGFEWNAEIRTSISSNDGISLLLFVKGKEVLDYVAHARNNGDFSNLSGKCFSREKATFVQDPAPINGWPGLFNKNEA